MKRTFGLVSMITVADACSWQPVRRTGRHQGCKCADACRIRSGGSGNAVEILIQSFAFSPKRLQSRLGTEVKWTNEDAPGHTVLSDDGTTIKSPTLNKGESFSMVFNTPGTYTYYCSIHPSMKGTIVVTQ